VVPETLATNVSAVFGGGVATTPATNVRASSTVADAVYVGVFIVAANRNWFGTIHKLQKIKNQM
jgi:hypothetical protein